jgi:hypothetical protein
VQVDHRLSFVKQALLHMRCNARQDGRVSMKAQPLAFWGRAVAVWLLWLLLMLGFELAIGRARGFAWARIAAEFDPRQGGFMLVGLLLMLLAPMLGAWLRGRQRT